MSRYRQPWEHIELAGREFELQVLDPGTAFELEPELVGQLGEATAMAIAAPGVVLSGVWSGASKLAGLDEAPVGLRDALQGGGEGRVLATASIAMLGRVLADCLMTAQPSHEWAVSTFRRAVLGRLRVEGRLIRTPRDWRRAALGPWVKWQALAAQLQQTFGPLWTRSPFRHRGPKVKDYGVKSPDVPVAVAWANALAKSGSAGSSLEVLERWTPVHMIQIVEEAAADAERHRRMVAEADAQRSAKQSARI